jgi:glycosyltransferase involved in cell wall biosynthesis
MCIRRRDELVRLSVALCPFNGERFLAEQLRSLAEQRRPPDELVICDDASTDGTRLILERFEARFPVRVHFNPVNLGVAGNFTQAIGLCTGDAIFTCDQDDVWHPNKLAATEARLTPDFGFAFSDAVRIDEAGNELRHSLWGVLAVSPRELNQLEFGEGLKTLCRRNIVTGATMAFHAKWRELVLPVPAGWIHDAWIALLISAVAPAAALREPLIKYRQHASQLIGEERLGLFEQSRRAREMDAATFQNALARFTEARDRLAAWPGVPAESLRWIEAKVRHCEVRSRMRESKWRLPAILGEWTSGRYSRFSRGGKAALQDWFLP